MATNPQPLYSGDPEVEMLCVKIAEAVRGRTNAKGIAKAVHGVVRKLAADPYGQDPAIETTLVEPGGRYCVPANGRYIVSWEAGPYDWAIAASFAIMNVTGKLCEPYHGFDLCFYLNED